MRHRLLVAAIAPVLLAPVLVGMAACGGQSSSSTNTASTPIPASPQVPEAKSSVARTPEAAIDPSALANAVSASNAFATDLFARLVSQAPTDNLVLSPVSASMALTMAYAGAEGETASQMATALHFPATASALFDGQNALGALLSWQAPDALGYAVQTASENGDPAPDPNDYVLQIVSSVWGDQSYTWAPAFLDTLAASYGSGVYEQDFIHQSDTSRQTINTWVDSARSGEITNLLPQGSVGSDTRLLLANALHLKLPWKTAFDAAATANAPFTRADGSTVTVPLMNLQAWMPYISSGASDGTTAQLIYLPLADGALDLIIAVPSGDIGTYAATANAPFTRADGSTVTVPFMNLQAWMPYVSSGASDGTTAQLIYLPLADGALDLIIAVPSGDIGTYAADLASGQMAIQTPYSQELVALSVPKVSFTSASFSLKTPLQAMGMTDAFTDTADFSGACAHTADGAPIQLSDVLQKTTLSLEENGVEASAATAVIVPDAGTGSTQVNLPTSIVINHPFVIVVLDTTTNALLLVGQVQDPSSSGSP